tara:strand:- start:427 stop:783 length:357 start_codon:yes stop_codon:yes gene_type:complete
MSELIFANAEHEILITKFINLSKEFAEEVSTKEKYKNYQDILQIIFDYHNTYGKSATRQNWFDWIMILPINISVMTQGFFAGCEHSRNRAKINSYRVLLTKILEQTVDSIDKMEYKNE